MKLTDYLGLETIEPALRATDKAAVLEELAGLLARRAGVSATRVERLLAEREALSTTGVGGELAIPHCKLAGARDIALALGVRPSGIDYGALDGKPVRLFVAVLSPLDSAGVHLAVLARIASLFREPAFREDILAAPSREAIFQRIEAAEEARLQDFFHARHPHPGEVT